MAEGASPLQNFVADLAKKNSVFDVQKDTETWTVALIKGYKNKRIAKFKRYRDSSDNLSDQTKQMLIDRYKRIENFREFKNSFWPRFSEDDCSIEKEDYSDKIESAVNSFFQSIKFTYDHYQNSGEDNGIEIAEDGIILHVQELKRDPFKPRITENNAVNKFVDWKELHGVSVFTYRKLKLTGGEEIKQGDARRRNRPIFKVNSVKFISDSNGDGNAKQAKNQKATKDASQKKKSTEQPSRKKTKRKKDVILPIEESVNAEVGMNLRIPNPCYAYALFQALKAIPEFMNAVKTSASAGNDFSLRLLPGLNGERNMLETCMGDIFGASQLRYSKQEDPHELLQAILSKYDEDEAGAAASTPNNVVTPENTEDNIFSSYENSISAESRIFATYYKLEKTETVTNNKENSLVLEKYVQIIPRKETLLSEEIYNTLGPTQPEGSNFITTKDIWKSPDCLNVSILRTQYNQGSKSQYKAVHNVTIEKEIQLYEAYNGAVSEVQYELTALIYHLGNSYASGHYKTIVKTTNSPNWVEYDDGIGTDVLNIIQRLTQKDVETGVHSCFYVRKDAGAAGAAAAV